MTWHYLLRLCIIAFDRWHLWVQFREDAFLVLHTYLQYILHVLIRSIVSYIDLPGIAANNYLQLAFFLLLEATIYEPRTTTQ